jgi:hypothetical protein
MGNSSAISEHTHKKKNSPFMQEGVYNAISDISILTAIYVTINGPSRLPYYFSFDSALQMKSWFIISHTLGSLRRIFIAPRHRFIHTQVPSYSRTMTPLPTRTLGRNGPQVTALGFGTMGLSSFYGPVPSDEERFEILDYVFESGVTNWDSSDLYGDSEQLIGKWFSRTGLRDQVFLATKFGFITTPPGGIRSDPEYVKEACAKSLKRLGVEMIDLYYAHRLDMKTPIEKTVQAMVELKNQGMIKYLGLSEVSADTLHRA